MAAAQFGGFVIGADIDYLMLHGKTKPTRAQERVSFFIIFTKKKSIL